MCGIAGILSFAPDAPVAGDELRLMAGQLVHRGPDDEGYHVDPQNRCGLAFRRLSIIDVAGGHQPLSNEDGTVWVIFNGEIYNFGALRQELEARGHRFATRTDTEVIVHLYEDLGTECFARLAGMFAIAIWDARRGRLLLARDRFGKKPLTYIVYENRLYFASEAKAILALPGVPRELDPRSLHRYLVFQYVPAPHSIYKGFHKLLPGHYLSVDVGRGTPGGVPTLSPQTYWQLTPQRFEGGYAEAKERLGQLLRAAVEKRLIADVPLGAFLSGGIDSSIVVALMRELGVSPLRTFSIGFADRRYNEAPHARLVAERFGTEHHEHLVTPQAREVLATLAYHYDEPFADSSAIPTYYVSRWTRQSVTVALTGDGGDESFAGYDRYRAEQLTARLDGVPRPLRRALAAAASLLPHSRPRTLGSRLYRLLAILAEPPAQRYLSWINVFPPAWLAVGYRDEFRDQLDLDEPLRWFEGLHDATGEPAPQRAMRADFASYLPYDLLTKVDLASMACGLECRAPFLDHELVEFALSLPLAWRLGARGGKRILKDWARDLLPKEILSRPKMGFGVPVGAWFRNELRDLLRERLTGAASVCGRVFRREWLDNLIAAHISGRANFEHPLWALLMLELWHERWQAKT
jgi:asparagine synthase (glutamine-hydrolysing)